MYEKDSISYGKHYGSNSHANPEAFYLPHSCDEWVIGGIEEAGQLIEDLQLAIEKLKKEEGTTE